MNRLIAAIVVSALGCSVAAEEITKEDAVHLRTKLLFCQEYVLAEQALLDANLSRHADMNRNTEAVTRLEKYVGSKSTVDELNTFKMRSNFYRPYVNRLAGVQFGEKNADGFKDLNLQDKQTVLELCRQLSNQARKLPVVTSPVAGVADPGMPETTVAAQDADQAPFGAPMGMTRAELESALNGKLTPATTVLSVFQGAPAARHPFDLYLYIFRSSGGLCSVGGISGALDNSVILKQMFDDERNKLTKLYGPPKFERIDDHVMFFDLKTGTKKLSSSWVVPQSAKDNGTAYKGLVSATLWAISGKDMTTGNLRVTYRYANGSQAFLAGGVQNCD